MNTGCITVAGKKVNFGEGQSLQISCTILFKEEESILKFKKKTVELVPFIIVCTLEILSVKYEQYQCHH